MNDPLSPPWEACKVCGGDHWTKDHALFAPVCNCCQSNDECGDCSRCHPIISEDQP